MSKSKSTVTNHRNAINGRFVTEKYVKTHRSTTTTEHNPRNTPNKSTKSR